MTEVTIGNSLKTIGGFAFRSCPITSISIPESVETIGRGAFQYCSDLAFVAIGNGVKEIRYEAFDGCYSLTNVTIPDSVTMIGNNAFSNCSSLETVYCKPDVPPTSGYWPGERSWNAFDNNASGRKIYVPSGSTDAYKAADGWSAYASDIVGYDF